MDLLDRFFGRGTPTPGGPPVANPRVERPVNLMALFDAPLDLDADALTLALRGYDPRLTDATAEVHVVDRTAPPEGHPENDSPPALLGLAAWGRHVVKLIGFNAPMPPEVVEACVRPAHYVPELKQAASEHAAHVLLYYAGYEPDPVEQYAALATVVAALARFGAVVVANEVGRTSVPAAALLPHDDDPDGMGMYDAVRTLPLPFLYVGFVKLEVEGQDGVWMRTYGSHVLGLPDLAFRAAGHDRGQTVFEIFGNMLGYLRESGRSFAPGHTLQVGPTTYFRLRPPAEAEWFLESEGELFVCEVIPAEEANGPSEPGV
jgi:hypothetical protein